MKKAYIFDLDGVLIDSKHMMSQAWQMCELEHKLEQPFSEYFKHIGMPFKDILKTISNLKKNRPKITIKTWLKLDRLFTRKTIFTLLNIL